MVLLDVTILNVALPSIRHSLGVTSSILEWVIAGYSLALGLALIPAGRMGDSIGHRKIFLVGLFLFTVASLLCSMAQNPTEIIIGRLLQGLSAGIFQPAVTSFIQLLFQGRDRGKAFSLYGTTIGLGATLGPLLGGLLVHIGGQEWGWRLVFLINIPIGIIVLLLARRMLPSMKSERTTNKRIDPIGIGLLLVALLLVLIPLIEGQRLGWPVWTYTCFLLAIPLFAALWTWETQLDRHHHLPLVAVHLLRIRTFSTGLLLVFVYFAAFTTIAFIISILLQSGLGYGALATGLTIAPLAIGSMIASSQSHRLSQKLGRRVLVIGCSLVATSLLLLLILLKFEGSTISAWMLTAPLLLGGIGSGLFIAPSQDFVLADIPARDAGSAAGMLAMAQDASTAFGIAIVGTVLFSNVYLGSGVNAATAYSQGIQAAIVVVFILILLALALVFLLPKQSMHSAPVTSK